MSKITLIIKREYTTRVMKKSFIILTFLTPLLFAGMITVPLWLASLKDTNKKHIVVIDKTAMYRKVLKSNESYIFDFVDKPAEEVRKDNGDNKDFTALLLIRGDLSKDSKAATLYSREQVNMELKTYISGLLNNYVEQQKLAAYNIPNLKQMVENSRTNIDIPTIKWGNDGNEQLGSSELALVIGMISAFIIYMFIVIYGAQVMAGVVQEKTSRIVEVIISSVKPFELMMGKIIGIALVGLTQIFLWVLLTATISYLVNSFLGTTINLNALNEANQAGMGVQAMHEGSIQNLFHLLKGFDLLKILSFFIVYFLGGYLLYASLFAAVGSAVDSETDTQQFSLPLTLPIIFAIYAAIYSAQNPDGPLALWCSMIPFTSPIVMMVRLPFGVPFWQIVVSLTILVLSFIGTTWMAGKIYRTGILMYGKKVSWKELWKWLRY
ncbi:MAG: ABC transporter permease [Bacteroidota bacterium]|nr:ABC transporter permease [Bacteroidota bacterium]